MTRPTDSHALNSISVTACRKSRMCWEALSCRPVFLESKIHPGSCIFHRPVEFRFMFQHHRQVNYLWISKILCHQIAQLRIKRRPWQKTEQCQRGRVGSAKKHVQVIPWYQKDQAVRKQHVFLLTLSFFDKLNLPSKETSKGCHCCCRCTAYRWVAKRVRYGLNLEMSATLHHRCHRVSLSVA